MTEDNPQLSKYAAVNPQIDESDFLVIDVETTGLSVELGDRVCEIGAVKIRGGAVVETLSNLINPQRPISSGAYAVNRISPQMLFGAPYFSEVAEKLWQMMSGTILVAYNAPFDLSFITNEFRLSGYPPIKNTVIDALAIARQLLPGLQSYQQEKVAVIAGIRFPVKHRALEDALVTAQLFTIFTLILKAYGFPTCADLQRRDLSNILYTKRMSIVQEALSGRNNLWIKYLSPTNAEITERIITPKECVEEKFGRNASTYLNAYCHSANAERNFRIDRILDLRIV